MKVMIMVKLVVIMELDNMVQIRIVCIIKLPKVAAHLEEEVAEVVDPLEVVVEVAEVAEIWVVDLRLHVMVAVVRRGNMYN